MSTVIAVLVVCANVLGAGMIVPQVVRLHRTGLVGGLSGIWVGIGLSRNSWWLVYALQGELWGIVPVSLGALALYAVLTVQLKGLLGPASLRAIGTGFAALGLVPIPGLVFGGWEAAGVIVGLCYGLAFIPAAVEVFRADDLGGVSIATWVMALAEAVIWLAYGTYASDLPLTVGGGSGSIVAVAIVARIVFVARRSSATQRTPSSYRRSVPSEDRVPARQ